MKRLLSLCLSALFFALACGAQTTSYIKVNLKGVSETDTLTLLWGANNKSSDPLITQAAAKKDCMLSLQVSEPRLVVLGVKGKQATCEILVSPGDMIEVTGRMRQIITSQSEGWIFRGIEVEGAALQAKYEEIIERYRKHQDSIDAEVQKEYKDVAKILQKSKQNENEQAIAEMYQTLHGQSYIDRVMNAFLEKEDYTNQTISAHKDSFLGPLLLLKLSGRLDKSKKPLYDEMSAAAQQSFYGKEVKEEVAPQTLVGDVAAEFLVQDTLGVEITLQPKDFKSEYILLDFWASWCQPCRKEMPNLKRIKERFGDRGLRIIGISVDHDEELWLESLKEVDAPWEHYWDLNRSGLEAYNVQYIPSIFIIDKNGRIIGEKLRGSDLTEFVEKLFSK